MLNIVDVEIISIRKCRPGLIRGFFLVCQAAFLGIFCAVPAYAVPVILNQPLTALPGNVVGVTGSGFGSSPRVYFTAVHSATQVPVKLIKGDNTFVAFQVPKSQPFDVYKIAISDGASWSPIVKVNNPRSMHFDKPEIASGDSFRIFGRNLYVAPGTPTVTLVDGGNKLAAAVDLSRSDAYSLTVTAPAGLIAGRNYRVLVSNGFGSAYSDICIIGHAAAGDDHFALGMPWGRDFIYQNGPNYTGIADNADHHVFDVTSDPFVTPNAKGDGIADDQPAIQAAINLAGKHGGGVVYLPAGTYRLASPHGLGLIMQSGVVVQGHSATDTTVLYGPAQKQSSSYQFYAIYWAPNANLSGLADLSLKNIDTLSQFVVPNLASGPTSKLFIQRVNWDLGTGYPMNFNSADRLVVANSTIRHPINRQYPDSVYPDKSGAGPLFFSNLTNFTFRNNNLWWASASIAFLTINAGVIEGNHFTRSASDKIVVTASNFAWLNGDYQDKIAIGQSVQRQLGRQIATETVFNLVIQNNTFDVSDGVLRHNFSDGETIESEGGAYWSNQDIGTVTSASTATVTDDSKCAVTCSWNYKPASALNAGSKIAIVSGKGRGQWRQIVSRTNNTFTISRPWNIVPAPGDNFEIFLPTMENTLIRTNILKDNPRGIVMFAAGFYNVSLLNNSLTDNGGIILYSIQDTKGLVYAHGKVGSLRNIEVIGNTLTNTKGVSAAHIAVEAGIRDPNYIWGTALDGIEVRNNSIAARPGTPITDYADGSYTNGVRYTNPDGPYSPNGSEPGVVGTILQGNNCTNCPVFYYLSTGALDTMIWNSKVNGAATLSPVIKDQKIGPAATQASTGTVAGQD